MKYMRRYLGLTLASLVLLVAGCNHTPAARTDAQIASDVQNKINTDNNLPEKQLTINANNGVVTLSGNVSSDQARNSAATDAAQVRRREDGCEQPAGCTCHGQQHRTRSAAAGAEQS